MIRPTLEQVAQAKADAQAKHGRSEVIEVCLGKPIDFCLLVAPLNLETYCVKADGDADDLQTSHRNVVRRHAVWPDASEVSAMLDKRPAMAQKIVVRMLLRAGSTPDESLTEPLADAIARAPKDGDVIPGLSRADADKLMAKEPDAELWAVVGPGPLSLVMAAPEGESWLAAATADAKARSDKRRVVNAKLEFALQVVRWSRQPIADLLNDLPALSLDIRGAYDVLGGDGADVTSKSL